MCSQLRLTGSIGCSMHTLQIVSVVCQWQNRTQRLEQGCPFLRLPRQVIINELVSLTLLGPVKTDC
jgi:hypothetical protein